MQWVHKIFPYLHAVQGWTKHVAPFDHTRAVLADVQRKWLFVHRFATENVKAEARICFALARKGERLWVNFKVCRCLSESMNVFCCFKRKYMKQMNTKGRKEEKNTLLRVIPTMTCRVGVVRWGLLSTVGLNHMRHCHVLDCTIGTASTHLPFILWRWRSSETCADPMEWMTTRTIEQTLIHIQTDISSDILTCCLTFCLAYLLPFCLTFIWHISWHSLSRSRSGREHWPAMVAVEVRQGTLDVAARGWGEGGGGEGEGQGEGEN